VLDNACPFIGILAQNVTRVTTLDPDAPGTHPGPETAGVRGLGKILSDATGLIQLVYVDELVPADVLAALGQEDLVFAGTADPVLVVLTGDQRQIRWVTRARLTGLLFDFLML